MTEPRVPETDPSEGESTQPIQARPDVSGWYPVEAAGPQPEETDPRAEPVEEPALVEAPAAVNEPAPTEFEPATEGFAAGPIVPETQAEVAVPADSSEPTVPTAAPEPTSQAGIWAPVVEPEANDPEPTTVVGEPEPTTVVPETEATTVVPETEHTTGLGDTEPTAVLRAPAEPTQVVQQQADVEPTSVLHREPAVEPFPVAVPPTESIFRPPSPATGSSPDPEPTRMEYLSDEERKLAAERAARREARASALAAPAPQPLAAPEPVIVHKRTNDKFLGSVGLFLLRLVLAAIFAVRGLNLLTDIPAAQAMFATTIIPEPAVMAIVTGVAALLIALSLILGLLTRLAGLGIALIAGGALTFVYWGSWSPFVAGRPGFLGEFELLLAAVGVLLICIGAGGWSLDRSFRAGRERDKADRAATADS